MHDSQRVLQRLAMASFLVGVILAAMGVYLVYIGAQGETEFALFGQRLQSTNVGVACIFIAAVLIILNLRRTLASFDRTIPTQEGEKAPGKLRVTQVRVTQDEPPEGPDDMAPRKCLLDFWISNDGGSQVTITAVDFEVVDTARAEVVKGAMPASETYDLDLTELREPGQKTQCAISQEVLPGESDRFTLELQATLGLGVFAFWKLKPTLVTNYGNVTTAEVEVWLPFRDDPTSTEDLKNFQAMERKHGIHR